MKEDHVNSRHDFEKVQQKVEDYKKVLTTLKNESTLAERIKKLEKSMETIHHKQNTKIQKYEEEILKLSTQLDTLNHTVFTLTEKITTIMKTISQEEQASKTTRIFPSVHNHSPIREAPSFKRLQNLLTEQQSVELETGNSSITPSQIDNRRKRRQKRHFPNPTPKAPPRKTMPDLNQPSAQKKFSVKLATTNNNSTHLKVRDVPTKETINDIDKTSNKEASMPEPKQLAEDHQSNDEQLIEPAAKNNVSSSLLNFFRKK